MRAMSSAKRRRFRFDFDFEFDFCTLYLPPADIVDTVNSSFYGNFLLLRPYHGEHGPKVSVTPECRSLIRQK
jgi:hypothetical protein